MAGREGVRLDALALLVILFAIGGWYAYVFFGRVFGDSPTPTKPGSVQPTLRVTMVVTPQLGGPAMNIDKLFQLQPPGEPTLTSTGATNIVDAYIKAMTPNATNIVSTELPAQTVLHEPTADFRVIVAPTPVVTPCPVCSVCKSAETVYKDRVVKELVVDVVYILVTELPIPGDGCTLDGDRVVCRGVADN